MFDSRANDKCESWICSLVCDGISPVSVKHEGSYLSGRTTDWVHLQTLGVFNKFYDIKPIPITIVLSIAELEPRQTDTGSISICR